MGTDGAVGEPWQVRGEDLVQRREVVRESRIDIGDPQQRLAVRRVSMGRPGSAHAASAPSRSAARGPSPCRRRRRSPRRDTLARRRIDQCRPRACGSARGSAASREHLVGLRLRRPDGLESADRLGVANSSSPSMSIIANQRHQPGRASRRWYSSSSPASQRALPGSAPVTNRGGAPRASSPLRESPWRGPVRHRRQPLGVHRSHRDEPVAQRQRRAAVLVVVACDAVELGTVARLDIPLVGEHGVGARAHVGRAPEAGEPLDLLQPVRLDADAHPLAQHVEGRRARPAAAARRPRPRASRAAAINR